jgi:UPF0755 protein
MSQYGYGQNQYNPNAPMAANPGYPKQSYGNQQYGGQQQSNYPPPNGGFSGEQQQPYQMNQQQYPQQQYQPPPNEPPVNYGSKPEEGERFRPKKVSVPLECGSCRMG